MVEVITHSEKETKILARDLARFLPNGSVLALTGPLGSGKTSFVKGLSQGLGIKKRITSPTFVIYKPYPLPGKAKIKLYHFDLYRLEGTEQLQELGFSEIINDKDNISVIEWADKIQGNLPARTIYIKFRLTPVSNARKITFS